MKVLILGGTGQISRAIVPLLQAKQHEVTLFNRGQRTVPPPGVRVIVGDRADREGFRTRMQAENFDVVIDMIAFTEEDARSTVDTFGGRVAQIIVCSSSSAYARPYRTVPIREDAEVLCDDPSFPYSYNKAQIERYLQALMREQGLPITLIRPSLTFGPGAMGFGVLRQNYGVIDRLRRGKPLVMFGDGLTPWSFTFAPDLAVAFAGAVGNPATYGQHYHATNETPTVWRDLYLEAGRVLGVEPRLFYLPAQVLHRAAPNLCAHLLFEKSYPGLFDNSKIRRDIPEFAPRIGLHEGLATLFTWFEAEAPTIDPEKDALEDRLHAHHSALMEQVADLYTK
ncbi:MAG: NAD-dependent epimerase/dehydratase family protein [Rhodocyclaceae bacterium]